MNRERLQKVFENYIRKFDIINDSEHDENFKWEVAANFRTLMDTTSPNFKKNIKEAVKLSSVLIDGKHSYCFSALAKCAEDHETEVKALFNALFADDGGDLVVRQAKILTFIENANTLVSRVYAANSMYMNDQRSVMAYFFLNDPENNFLYKYTAAKRFAACIGFYGDWGAGLDFHLDVYYRMCELLVREIKNSPELIVKHNERYKELRYIDQKGSSILHPDKNYHILAFDIIYGATEDHYNFYEGMHFPDITAEDYERARKAKKLYEKWEQAKARVELLEEGESYFNRVFSVNKTVRDKSHNEGIITKIDQYCVYVQFPQQTKPKAYLYMKSYLDKMLTTDDPDLEVMIEKYQEVMKIGTVLRSELKKAEEALIPYREYLEQ